MTENPRYTCNPTTHSTALARYGECGACGETNPYWTEPDPEPATADVPPPGEAPPLTNVGGLCYFCGTVVENPTREQIFIPATEQHVSGYVCPNDVPRLRLRQAAARSAGVGR